MGLSYKKDELKKAAVTKKRRGSKSTKMRKRTSSTAQKKATKRPQSAHVSGRRRHGTDTVVDDALSDDNMKAPSPHVRRRPQTAGPRGRGNSVASSASEGVAGDWNGGRFVHDGSFVGEDGTYCSNNNAAEYVSPVFAAMERSRESMKLRFAEDGVPPEFRDMIIAKDLRERTQKEVHDIIEWHKKSHLAIEHALAKTKSDKDAYVPMIGIRPTDNITGPCSDRVRVSPYAP